MERIINYIYEDYYLHLQSLFIQVALVSLHSKTTRLNKHIPYHIGIKMRTAVHLIIFSEWHQWLHKHISIVMWNENVSNVTCCIYKLHYCNVCWTLKWDSLWEHKKHTGTLSQFELCICCSLSFEGDWPNLLKQVIWIWTHPISCLVTNMQTVTSWV